ncbi:hypothetical protein HanPSC8_Chr02g0056081 [Helianthus annuus]|nr:hypothetical protein HanPSC8_Chr02g0056081 [Helianthus annuus]
MLVFIYRILYFHTGNFMWRYQEGFQDKIRRCWYISPKISNNVEFTHQMLSTMKYCVIN